MTGCDTAAIVAAVESATGSSHVTAGPLRPYQYAKSSPLYTTTVHVDGRDTDVVVKDVSWSSLLPGARKVKPAVLHDPVREVTMYRDVLADVDGPAAFYGHHVDESTGAQLLVIERVEGLELCDVGDLGVWMATARWLGRFHARADDGAAHVPLVRHTADHHRALCDRAASTACRLRPEQRRRLRHVLDVYDRYVIDRLTAAPVTVIHGEMYPSNVVVGGARPDGTLDPNGVRICPVDWETAAAGPALLDLAAITTGDWSDDVRRRLVDAYVEGSGANGDTSVDVDLGLAACRAQLAVQWLGWFVDHSPPPWQARGWLDEALHAAERLG
jgi:aminoglycoside phosphotransferase (APT) family kinase protein